MTIKIMDKKEDLIRLLKREGFSDDIISAFDVVKREKFVQEEHMSNTYEDVPLPIGHGQTISQPSTIAFMLRMLEVMPSQKILEIGSGSGYVLDLLSHLSPDGKIFGIERIKELAESSSSILSDHKNIKVIHSDGSNGLSEESPFDRILVSAASVDIPQKLTQQLKTKGILVAPVGNSIIKVKKESGMNKVNEYPGFVFVPLVKGKENSKGGEDGDIDGNS